MALYSSIYTAVKSLRQILLHSAKSSTIPLRTRSEVGLACLDIKCNFRCPGRLGYACFLKRQHFFCRPWFLSLNPMPLSWILRVHVALSHYYTISIYRKSLEEERKTQGIISFDVSMNTSINCAPFFSPPQILIFLSLPDPVFFLYWCRALCRVFLPL